MKPILLIAALALSGSCQAAVTLQVATAAHHESAKSVSNAPADSKAALEVALADDYIAVKGEQSTTIYDFKKRRRLVLDDVAHTYVDYSLYDTAGFRVLEMRNRIGMNLMLAKINPAAQPQRTADLEQELSIAENSATVIDESASGDARVFSSEGRPLATWSKGGARAAAPDVSRFAQFILYTQGGHPQLLAKLAQGGTIPARLTFTVATSFGVTTYSTEVVQGKAVPPPAYTLQGYTRRQAPASDGWLDATLDRMAALTPEQLAALRAAHPCDTAADYREDQLVDTMLGRTECVLATGAPMLPFTAEQLEKVRANKDLSLMLAATQPPKPENIAAMIQTLVDLRPKAPRKVYILKLFEANNRMRAGQQQDSLRLFGEVLEANPALGGAWKDAGDLMASRYDMPHAWRLWDTGRRIAPTGIHLGAVTQFETELVKRHPEYF